MFKLKAKRLEHGLTQQDLGFHARMAGADISRIERGWMKPYPSQAIRLAEALGLAPQELLEEVSFAGERQATHGAQ